MSKTNEGGRSWEWLNTLCLPRGKGETLAFIWHCRRPNSLTQKSGSPIVGVMGPLEDQIWARHTLWAVSFKSHCVRNHFACILPGLVKKVQKVLNEWCVSLPPRLSQVILQVRVSLVRINWLIRALAFPKYKYFYCLLYLLTICSICHTIQIPKFQTQEEASGTQYPSPIS